MQVDLELLIAIAREAGEEVMRVYAGEFEVETKADHSPLTEADRRSNAVILRRLEEHYPRIPRISEESREIPYAERRDWEWCWLIDPLDGTKEFVKRNGEFTVNIALVCAGRPICGVVCRPAERLIYCGAAGEESWRVEPDGSRLRLGGGAHYLEKDRVTVVASRSHLTEEVERFVGALREGGKEVDFVSAGSSLKFCLVAEGSADVYPRFGPTMEWDTAAAHAVALGAGRSVRTWPDREALRYNKEDLLNPWFVVE
jgi:3'(2'), 5'-bisphosphate nucleotidase